MNKIISRALTIAAMSVAPMLSASTTLEVNIPFGFVVGHSALPAGHYEVSIDEGLHLIRIKGNGARPSMFFLTRPADAVTVRDDSSVVFHRQGDEYTLSVLWVAGEKNGQKLPEAH